MAADVDDPVGPPEAVDFSSRAPVVAGLSIRYLRVLATCEAIAFLLLLTFAVLNSTERWGWVSTALFVMGNVHGAVFTTYLVSIVVFHRKLDWGPLTLLAVLVCGFIPGGGIVAERWALADSHVRKPGEARRPWFKRSA
jgi:integral membrane protein